MEAVKRPVLKLRGEFPKKQNVKEPFLNINAIRLADFQPPRELMKNISRN
jgi:hypothetical protein